MKTHLKFPLILACLIAPLQPALAQSDSDKTNELSLELHGLARGYVVYNRQSEAPGSSARTVDFLRHTEFEWEASTTLANGTELGMMIEWELGREEVESEKSYLFAQGDWGRINFGAYNGVAYLMQVSAPAADSNIDGPRQYIRPTNYALAPVIFAPLTEYDLEYAHDTSGSTDKISYITPQYSGFQLGLSYAPDSGATDYIGHQESTAPSRSLNGVNTDNVPGEYGSTYDLAARYETKWNEVDLSLGAGYVGVRHEREDATETDLHSWNAGVNLGYEGARLGVSYSENDNGQRQDRETRILVVGTSYESGSWHYGASYYNRTDENFNAGNALDTSRYSLGAAYKYGPGMSARASLHHIDHEAGPADMDSSSLLLGTQINF